MATTGTATVQVRVDLAAFARDLRNLADKIDTIDTTEPPRESNLVSHARHELALLGDPDDPMNRQMADHLVHLVQVFADGGHSGMSGAYAIGALTRLLNFEPLTPLTGAPDEWVEVGDGMWQNKRCGRVFSDTGTPDGHAYDIEGRVFIDPDGGAFVNRDSHIDVTFPYTPATERVNR